MPTQRKVRDFNFLHLIGAMGTPKNEIEKCLIDSIGQFKTDKKSIVVGMYRFICLVTDKKGLKTDIEKKSEFWQRIAEALKIKGCQICPIMDKAIAKSEIGLDLYKRIDGYMNQFVIHFPTQEIAEYFFKFFFVLIEPSTDAVSIEMDPVYESVNEYMAKKRLENFLKKLPANDKECAYELMEGSKNVDPAMAQKVRNWVKSHLHEAYDRLVQ